MDSLSRNAIPKDVIPGDVPPKLANMVKLQAEQLRIKLEPWGLGWRGEARNSVGAGYISLLPLSPNHAILEHGTTVHATMPLYEQSASPYACISACNTTAFACSRATDLPVCHLGMMCAGGYESCAGERPECFAHQPRGQGDYATMTQLFSFTQPAAHETVSQLQEGRFYRSRCIIMLPGYFDDLDRQYAGNFSSIFNLVGTEAASAFTPQIEQVLGAITCSRPFSSTETLRTHALVDILIGKMASGLSKCNSDYNERYAQDSQADALARRCVALIRESIDHGKCPGIAELAERLYVSRSHLCAVFKHQMGEGVASYAKRLRLERACELLNSPRNSVASVASALGFGSHASFSQAFKQAYGVSPSVWREMHY